MTELIYRVLFVSIFAVFWMVRIYYVRKSRDPDAPRTREERCDALKKEGWTGILLVVLTPIELILIVLFLWGPPWMVGVDLLFPFWLHWTGVGLLICSIPFAFWVHRTSGETLFLCS